MNSVFSAFKSNKNNETKSKLQNSSKKVSNQDLNNSYENLRHIREIGSSSKIMSTFIDGANNDDDGDIDDNSSSSISTATTISPTGMVPLTTGKRCPTPIQPIATSLKLADDHGCDIVDFCDRPVLPSKEEIVRQNLISYSSSDDEFIKPSIPIKLPNKDTSTTAINKTNFTECNLLKNNILNNASLSNSNNIKLTSSDNNILINNSNNCSNNANNSCNSNSSGIVGSNRLNRPRLSLSGIGTLPTVHGRQNITNGANSSGNGTNNGQNRTRLSTHQRNLSLDFRSMGILLPPVSQVTNTRINLTQHHRNRSLDSALQRIPEVEVSSPNAESENTLCTNSILGTTMCSKITASSTNPNNTPTVRNNSIGSTNRTDGKISNNENVIVSKEKDSKKREDLTSLGSDDSGIICGGSEPDQTSLTRIRRSRESLDSGEIDAEEECIEIETQSMDDEYRMLQNDLCFYQLPDKEAQKDNSNDSEENLNDIMRYREQNICKIRAMLQNSHNIKSAEMEDCDEEDGTDSKDNVAVDDVNDEDGGEDEEDDVSKDEDSTPTNSDSVKTPVQNCDENQLPEFNVSLPLNPTNATTVQSTSSKKEQQHQNQTTTTPEGKDKNDVIFRGFFGATRNAIFRTAQSIIDNHEKKNKDHHETPPVSVSKRKEFFTLKSNSNKNKTSTTNHVQQSTSDCSSLINSPDSIEPKNLTKSLSTTSLGKGKESRDRGGIKLPGIAQCLFKEVTPKEDDISPKNMSSSSYDKASHSGLLRFFESPIFNIHFAIHYLFYSKEPGVLSFIGNKIFSFPHNEVDLYTPQLILMYIQMDELADVLDPYLVYRCRRSIDFTLKCTWLLEAYNYSMDEYYLLNNNSNKKNQLSLMKELFAKKERKAITKGAGGGENKEGTGGELQLTLSPIKKTHHRSQSDATGLLNDSKRCGPSKMQMQINPKCYQPQQQRLCLGDLTTGRAFDNGCLCFETVRGTVNNLLGHKTVCDCSAPKLAPQKEFMKALIDIGKMLTSLPNKTEKNSRLRVLLNLINKNLPARVWLPLHSEIPHHIVRITEEKTAVLNSKDKTPYIIYVEVVEVNDIFSSPVIAKLMPTLRHTKSEEHLDINNSQTPSTNTTTTVDVTTSDITNTKEQQSTTKNQLVPPQIHCIGSKSGSTSQLHVRSEKLSECSTITNADKCEFNELPITEDDVWSQEDDEITAQYLHLHNRLSDRDTISQMSLDSCDSREQHHPMHFNIGDVRLRHCANLNTEYTKSFNRDPEDPSAAALKEPWHEKERQIRESSPYGHLSNWRLLSAIVKCGDDLRQELMATQLLQMFKIIWQEENVDLWVRPYKIVCLSNDSGLIEPILNTVSLHQIKKNSNKSLKDYFIDEYGSPDGDDFKLAQKNFMQSCAAYCLISYLLQVKDRHNGNILLHSDGHLIHIDFGFILNISPKNLGFEQSPFKLTPEFVEIMGGPSSELFTEFRHLLLKGLMAARKHMDRVINIVEIMRSSSQLPCFKNGCSGTVINLRKRFHMNLTEQELERKVDQLVFDSWNSLSTKLYDGYQYFTNGIL